MNREQISALRLHFFGHTDAPGRKDIEDAWKAVKAVAAAARPLGEPERLSLLARMSSIGTPTEVVEHVMSWNERAERAKALLARIAGSARVGHGDDVVRWRTEAWIIYAALAVAMVDGDLSDGEIGTVRSLAAGVDVTTATVDGLADVCREEAAIRRRRINLLASKSASAVRYDML